MEALIFVDGVSIASAGLEPELLKELKTVAEEPGCSGKRYRLTSVILHTQEIAEPRHTQEIAEPRHTQEIAEPQVDQSEAADTQEIAEPEVDPSEIAEPEVDPSEAEGSRKRKAADMDHS